MAAKPAVKAGWRTSVPTVVKEETPRMYTNMGKVRKPPPTPMMAATKPTTRPQRATKRAGIFFPPGTRSSSKEMRGGILDACSRAGGPALSDAASAPWGLSPWWAPTRFPTFLNLRKSNREYMPRNPRSTTYTTLMKVSLSTGLVSYTARLTNPPPMAPPMHPARKAMARGEAEDAGHQEGGGSVKRRGVRLLPAQHRGEIRGEGHGDEHCRPPQETQEPHSPFVLQDVAGDLHFPR